MKFRLVDVLLILALITLPIIGIPQACGSHGPIAPGSPGDKPPADNHAPVPVIKVLSATEGPSPLIAKLDAVDSSDPDGDPIRFMWLFSDGESAETSYVEHKFTGGGRFEVQLVVTDKWGVATASEPVKFLGYGLASSAWPKFAHDERNSGVSPNPGPMMDLERADQGGAFPRYWRSSNQEAAVTAVCVGYEGVVVYAQGQWLRARTPDGMTLWDTDLGSTICAWPAIADDGSIITATVDGKVHRLDADGQIIWTTDLQELTGVWVLPKTAINIGGNRTIYVGAISMTALPPGYTYIGVLFALAFDGSLLWNKSVLGTGDYQSVPLIPAITREGLIVLNGPTGAMFRPDGTQTATFEFVIGGAPSALGPPSVSEDGLIAFTHGQLPLFTPDGTLVMEIMGDFVDGSYDGSWQAGYVQAPVWDESSISQIQTVGTDSTTPYLTTGSEGGSIQKVRLPSSMTSTPYFAGVTQDSLGRMYVSCKGLHAVSDVSMLSVFPHVQRRYSLWTYERPTTFMTAPVIGEDRWLYLGYGRDIMALGD